MMVASFLAGAGVFAAGVRSLICRFAARNHLENEPLRSIAPRITICGIAELGEHSAAGITHVLSILDPNSPYPEFAALAPHRLLILRFHDVIRPERDQIAPTREDVERLLVFGREVSATPEAHLLVHCRAGVSRSTAAAALILMQANPKLPAGAALDAVAAIRPRAWPNLLILEFGDALLGRNGEIVAAAGAIYRRVLALEPGLGDQMINAGRDREVSVAYLEEQLTLRASGRQPMLGLTGPGWWRRWPRLRQPSLSRIAFNDRMRGDSGNRSAGNGVLAPVAKGQLVAPACRRDGSREG